MIIKNRSRILFTPSYLYTNILHENKSILQYIYMYTNYSINLIKAFIFTIHISIITNFISSILSFWSFNINFSFLVVQLMHFNAGFILYGDDFIKYNLYLHLTYTQPLIFQYIKKHTYQLSPLINEKSSKKIKILNKNKCK